MKNPFLPILTIDGLDDPRGITVNHRGEIVVTELGRHCVSVFSPEGKKLRSFGSQGSCLGQFQQPLGVAVDDEDNIVVADTGNHRIQKFNAEGQLINAAGTRGLGILQFGYPSDIAFDGESKLLYVVDSDSHRVQVLTSSLSFRRLLGKKGRKCRLTRPVGVACSKAEKVYVTDRNSHSIAVYSNEGLSTSHFGHRGQEEGQLYLPYHIAVDDTDEVLYVSEWGNNRISVLTLDGGPVATIGREGTGPGEFKFPRGVAVNSSNKLLYVCDGENNRIQVF
jgi:DNA-binding beta-propeller fold protein YncE